MPFHPSQPATWSAVPPPSSPYANSHSRNSPPGPYSLVLGLVRAAQKHGGKLTVAEGVLATGLTITQIEATLMEMAKTGYVQIENTDRGDLRFDFGDLPEYDEEEAMREAELEARELAVEDAAMMVEEEREQAVRGQRSAALKGGLAAGVAAVGVRALMGELLGDDDE